MPRERGSKLKATSHQLQVSITCPVPAGTTFGNRVTAVRYGRILSGLGHRVRIVSTDDAPPATTDVLLALHAKHSARIIADSKKKHPDRPVILVLTGTDLYRDIRSSKAAVQSLALADKLVVLQQLGMSELRNTLRNKSLVIYQSEIRKPREQPPVLRNFRVIVIGHLRKEKDPFRTARAARKLPPESKIAIEHYGHEREPGFAQRARQEMARNVRYRWLGNKPRWLVRRRLANAHLMVLSSRMEGGAGVMTEALAADVPILSTGIPGSVGMLGKTYDGYFNVGDTLALRNLLFRAESDRGFLRNLVTQCRRRAKLIDPSREKAAWARAIRSVI